MNFHHQFGFKHALNSFAFISSNQMIQRSHNNKDHIRKPRGHPTQSHSWGPKKTYTLDAENTQYHQSTLSLPESIKETCSVVLTFGSVDKILWCDHLNKTSLAVLLHGTMFLRI